MTQRVAPRRRLSIGSLLLAAITIAVALVTLLSLAPFPFLPESVQAASNSIGQILVQLVTVVGALAVIVGVLNLLRVHLNKLSRPSSAVYSLVTLITLVSVIILHVVEKLGILKVATASDSPLITLTLMDVLQVAIESALSGLLFFFLVYAAFRMMRQRVTVWGLLFTATLVLVLVGYMAPAGSLLANLRNWILRVPVSGGTRGLLIGIAIGTVTIGARVLIGQGRMFRE